MKNLMIGGMGLVTELSEAHGDCSAAANSRR